MDISWLSLSVGILQYFPKNGAIIAQNLGDEKKVKILILDIQHVELDIH